MLLNIFKVRTGVPQKLLKYNTQYMQVISLQGRHDNTGSQPKSRHPDKKSREITGYFPFGFSRLFSPEKKS